MARGSRSSASASLTAALPSLLTNRASSYVPSRERILPSIKSSCIHCHSSFRRPTEPELRAQRRDSDLCATRSSANADGKNSSSSFDSFKKIAAMPDIRLRPILTKPVEKEVQIRRVELRQIPPRIGMGRSKKKKKKKEEEEELAAVMKQRRAAVWGSAVVVKLSCDPARDFMESMVEMITENGIREVEELEELLACYLALNSEECHGVIIKVFEQILLLLINLHLL